MGMVKGWRRLMDETRGREMGRVEGGKEDRVRGVKEKGQGKGNG